MVRKRIRKILSGGAVVFIVLLCTVDVSLAWQGTEIKLTISGSAGAPDVTMTGFPSQDGKTVVTDQNGFYSAVVPFNWTGTVKPVKEGWQFEPVSKPYQRVQGNKDNENYMPTEITYTISGKVTGPSGPMSGVQMTGLVGTPITGADGSYSATVPYGWSETFTPIKDGYEFTPSNKGFGPARSNQVQNFSAAAVQLLITGTVGVPGVKMKGLPNDPVTGANGIYSVKVDYNWTGTITPEKEGYEFEPAEVPYADIITDQTNQNFNAKKLTYIVSGTAGMAGVEMKGLPGNPYTDQNGMFSAQVDWGFTGTVTPTREGYEFDPASFILANIKSDRSNLNCTGEVIKLTISGSTGIEGVQMTGLPENPITDKDGKYSAIVDWGWYGTVMPIKEGYKFTPEQMPYQSVTENVKNQNYTYTKITYTITGNAQIAGVVMKGFPDRAVITSASGSYTATVEHGWNGTVTPTKEGYDFEPASIPFTNILGPQSGQDFVGTLQQRKISGMVRTSKGQPVEGVNIVADNNGGQATTESNGQFEIVVGYSWVGTITALKEGYTFSPSIKRIAPIKVDQLNQTFMATPQMFTVTGKILVSGVPLDGVTITASDGTGVPITTTTDRQGTYTFQVPYGWTGDVTATKEGFDFGSSRPLIDVKTNIVEFEPVAPAAPPTTVTPVVKPGPTTPDTTVVKPGPTGTTTPGTPDIVVPGGPGPDIVTPGGPNVPDIVGPTSPEDKQMAELLKKIADLEKLLTGKGIVGPNAPGAVDATGMPLISNAWFQSDIALDVLPAISQEAGIPIIPDEGVGGPITLTLENEPLERALDLVLAGTPFTYIKRDNYYLVAKAELTDSKFPIFSKTRRVTLSYVTAQAAVGLLSTAFKPYAQAEMPEPEQLLTPGSTPPTYTTRTPKTYTVVVTAPPDLMERIIADLKAIDKMPDQVLLKARIVAMSRTDLLNLGVEWGWPTMQLGFFAGNNYGFGSPTDDYGGKAPWGIQMGYTPDFKFTNALQLALNLLTVNGEATIRAEPQVMALDGKEATMRVVNEEYFFLTADVGGTERYFTNSQLETIESGTTLTITPHIAEGERIVLDISVEVSDSVAAGRDTDLPIVTRRIADNTVTVNNGGTVALAGLSQEKSSTTHRRTPGLSNLPLIGDLFNNQNDMTTSREVAVFVTAHILPQSQYNAAASSMPRAAPPAPAGTPAYPMTPAELERTSPRVEPRYRPMDRGTTVMPNDPRYYPPTGSIRRTAPVYPQYNPPAPSAAPRMRLPSNFKDEIGRELNRNR